jgi:hypothetical protein|tara:strand:+ start:960 stop:1190 length:231 start_codon:yes stop_codon:yes gene_type:complete
MKITKQQLKQIIIEALDYELKSQAWSEGREDGLNMDNTYMDKWYEHESPDPGNVEGPYYEMYQDGYYQGQMDNPNY